VGPGSNHRSVAQQCFQNFLSRTSIDARANDASSPGRWVHLDEPRRRSPFRWAEYTVHSLFAGLTKRSNSVEVVERVHQVGLDKDGTRGTCTVCEAAP
jgi:hypothetical protein